MAPRYALPVRPAPSGAAAEPRPEGAHDPRAYAARRRARDPVARAPQLLPARALRHDGAPHGFEIYASTVKQTISYVAGLGFEYRIYLHIRYLTPYCTAG